uniref:Uncharacterized protein n=1 Tax=Rhizophora mucronata TaxID=61149 RepID=A0A2P2PJ05_RHIMU
MPLDCIFKKFSGQFPATSVKNSSKATNELR